MLKSLLIKAEYVDLTKTKSSISISQFIKLRLGDTFRFLTNHIERHIEQALHAAQSGNNVQRTLAA